MHNLKLKGFKMAVTAYIRNNYYYTLIILKINAQLKVKRLYNGRHCIYT